MKEGNKMNKKNITKILLILAMFCILQMNFDEKIIAASTTTNEATDSYNVKILFIGNSSTYYNDMPKMVKGLFEASGTHAYVEAITAPNYKLSQFATTGNKYNTQIVTSLSKTDFDYVVVQEHREPMLCDYETTEKAFVTLKGLIEKNGAEIVLYETQADKVGNTFTINNSTVYLDNPVIQYYINRSYYNLANSYNVKVCPSGLNYSRCTRMYPEINLYNSDEIHPTVAGSYMAACALYQSISGASAFGNEFLPGSEFDTDSLLSKLSEENATKLQAVSDTVLNFNLGNIEIIKGKSETNEALVKFSEGNNSATNNSAGITYSNSVSYSSLDDSKVAVNKSTGKITALATGKTMIMASTDSGLMAFYNVNVIQPATAMTLSQNSTIYLHRKDTTTIKATLSPSDATDNVTWTSDKPTRVSVNSSGKITALKVGPATITATTTSGIKLTRKIRVRLATPTKLTATQTVSKKKYGNVKLTWKKNSSAVKYYVYRSSGSGYKKIATVTKNSYTDKKLAKNKRYKYKIKSVYSSTSCNSLRSKYKAIYVR